MVLYVSLASLTICETRDYRGAVGRENLTVVVCMAEYLSHMRIPRIASEKVDGDDTLMTVYPWTKCICGPRGRGWAQQDQASFPSLPCVFVGAGTNKGGRQRGAYSTSTSLVFFSLLLPTFASPLCARDSDVLGCLI